VVNVFPTPTEIGRNAYVIMGGSSDSAEVAGLLQLADVRLQGEDASSSTPVAGRNRAVLSQVRNDLGVVAQKFIDGLVHTPTQIAAMRGSGYRQNNRACGTHRPLPEEMVKAATAGVWGEHGGYFQWCVGCHARCRCCLPLDKAAIINHPSARPIS
jgi:hypothetical protein